MVSSLERIADALDPGLVLGGRELVRLEPAMASLDRLAPLGRVERLALGRGEDEVEHGALLGRELRLDQVGRSLRVRARDRELVLETSPDPDDENDQEDDDPAPGQEHSPRVRGARPHPACQCSRGQALVR